MDWLEQNFKWLLTAGLIISSPWWLKVVKIVVAGARAWWSFGKKLEERRDHLLHVTEADYATYKRLCGEQAVTIENLNLRLLEKVRDCDERDEINAQDRYEIRLLHDRLRDNGIDYKDIVKKARSWRPPPL